MARIRWNQRGLRPMKTPISTSSRDRRLLAAVGALLLAGWADAAAAEPSPRDVVKSTTDQVLAVLAQKDLSKETRRDRVKSIVLQSTDFDTLSRLVLARNWSRFTPPQQQEFEREVQNQLSATYGRRLDTYRDDNVAIVGDRQAAKGDWTVEY